MKQAWRVVTAVLLFLTAILCLRAQTDRIFNGLTPTEGQAYSQPLKSGQIYTQVFQTPRTSLSQIGLWLTPLQRTLPAEHIQLTIKQTDTVLGSQDIAVVAIPREGPTYITIDPAIPTQRGATLQLELTVPQSLNNAVGVQLREPDDTFDAAAIPFFIDSAKQPRPMALLAYAHYRPSFMISIGIGLLISALFVLLYTRLKTYRWAVYSIAIGLVCSVPGLLDQNTSWLLLAATVVATSGMVWLLLRLSFAPVAAIVGANIFALTTWWPLQVLGQREHLLGFAVLPYVILAVQTWRLQKTISRRALLISVVWLLVVFVAGHQVVTTIPTQATADVKDIFIDPYQISAAEKSIGAHVSWDNFGSYIGIINVGLIVIGLLWQGWRRWQWTLSGLIILVIALWPPVIQLFSWLPIAPQHLLIITTLCLAYFAGWGMQGLHNYLRPSRLTTCLTWGIALLAILDLLYVWANVLEFTSL